MATQCYALVRGAAIRVTPLDACGSIPEPVSYAVSKSVATVRIEEQTESGADERLRTPEGNRRLRLVRPTQMIRHRVDIEFLRVDPSVFSAVSGVSTVVKDPDLGFGEMPFGESPFGLFVPGTNVIQGFDSGTGNRTTSFALEVWSKLAGDKCEGGQQWGYTLFPHLRGGRLSGFAFANGKVSFTLRGAQSRRTSNWGVGPYDITGPYERLPSPVSRNVSFRQTLVPLPPPEQTDGLEELPLDVVDNGTPDNPMPDPEAPMVLDGGGPVTSPWIVDGGKP